MADVARRSSPRNPGRQPPSHARPSPPTTYVGHLSEMPAPPSRRSFRPHRRRGTFGQVGCGVRSPRAGFHGAPVLSCFPDRNGRRTGSRGSFYPRRSIAVMRMILYQCASVRGAASNGAVTEKGPGVAPGSCASDRGAGLKRTRVRGRRGNASPTQSPGRLAIEQPARRSPSSSWLAPEMRLGARSSGPGSGSDRIPMRVPKGATGGDRSGCPRYNAVGRSMGPGRAPGVLIPRSS